MRGCVTTNHKLSALNHLFCRASRDRQNIKPQAEVWNKMCFMRRLSSVLLASKTSRSKNLRKYAFDLCQLSRDLKFSEVVFYYIFQGVGLVWGATTIFVSNYNHVLSNDEREHKRIIMSTLINLHHSRMQIIPKMKAVLEYN